VRVVIAQPSLNVKIAGAYSGLLTGFTGKTHQSVEDLAVMRAMPNMIVLRPGDANEVVEAWKVIAQIDHSPTSLVLSRQAMPTFDRSKYAPAAGVAKGAYVLADAPDGKPEVILMGTGSELSLCVDAYEKLKTQGIKARVVSMPSWEIFEKQDAAYKDSVLPPKVTARVSVEMAATFGWSRYTGSKGRNVGMHSFGASAPLKDRRVRGHATQSVVGDHLLQFAGGEQVAADVVQPHRLSIVQ